jgi:hypothetical protein
VISWFHKSLLSNSTCTATTSDFDAVMIDTDHLAACVLTKLALVGGCSS